MTFSILTVVKNDVQNIESTLLSVLSQSIPVQYIVIDGGSTDGTLDVLKRYEEGLDYLLSEPDRGIADAFNKSIKKCTGDVIGIINSGDWPEHQALEKVKYIFETNDCDIVYGDVQYRKDGKKEYRYSANHLLLKRFMSLNHPAVFVKKELYEKHGMFDERYRYAMDYELMLRFYLAGCKFCYINEVLANMSLGGVSDKNWRKAYGEVYEIKRCYFGGSVALYIDYAYHLCKRSMSNILSMFGMERLKSVYRRRFATIKKSIDETSL